MIGQPFLSSPLAHAQMKFIADILLRWQEGGHWKQEGLNLPSLDFLQVASQDGPAQIPPDRDRHTKGEGVVQALNFLPPTWKFSN